MKRLIALCLALLCLAGCAGQPAAKYAVARAEYPAITDYSDLYDKAADYMFSGDYDSQKVIDTFDALEEAMDANDREVRALRDAARPNLPDLTDFAAETAARVFAGREENTVYSPANLYMALAMLSEATAGDTRSQLTELLGTDDPATAANALWCMTYQNDRGKAIPANSLWLGEQYPVKQALADRLAGQYYADSFTVPMGTARADKAMAAWINDHTGNLLQEAADNLQSDPDNVLTLISTLYFEQMWQQEFFESQNTREPFYTADGGTMETEFMHASQSGSWHRGEGYVSAARYFQDSGGSMLFILPDEGILPEELLTDEDMVSDILTAEPEHYSIVNWSVPKFDVDSDMDLKEQLQALGVERVFDSSRSDFTPTTEAVAVEVSRVQHAARVKIDEKGCTAAAFTVIPANGAGMPPKEELDMNLNRPFAFVICSHAGTPLFMGTVYAP